jgi:hypothetical protein
MNRIRFYHNMQWYHGYWICNSKLNPDMCYVEDLNEEIYLIDKIEMEAFTFLSGPAVLL